MDTPSTGAPSRGRMFLRGCLKHSAVCGQGRLFRRWFHRIERCPRCGLRFDRIEGHWTGDLGLNTIVSFTALFSTLVIGFAITYPDIPGALLFSVAVSIALVVPLAFFPFSKTIWLSIDLMMRPLDPEEVKPAYRWPVGMGDPPAPES